MNIRTIRITEHPDPAQAWQEVRDICCATANSGAPIDRARWTFFGEFWVGPYQKLRPEWTWVSVDDSGHVAGYLTGCPDTDRFEREKRFRFLLPLFLRVLLGRFPRNGDTRRFMRRLLGREKTPEEFFSRDFHQRLSRDYPAHLHTNVRADFRGAGLGKALSEAYFQALRKAGVPGIHLYCGEGPIPFYRKQGLEILERIEFRPGVPVIAMGRKL